MWYAPRYREFHTLELDGINVKSKRGVVFRSETNVPLERITDVSVHQGPLMRNFGVYKVSVESAGQTQMQGAATIIGVADPYVFRDAVLENVEMIKQRSGGDGSTRGGCAGGRGFGRPDGVVDGDKGHSQTHRRKIVMRWCERKEGLRTRLGLREVYARDTLDGQGLGPES